MTAILQDQKTRPRQRHKSSPFAYGPLGSRLSLTSTAIKTTDSVAQRSQWFYQKPINQHRRLRATATVCDVTPGICEHCRPCGPASLDLASAAPSAISIGADLADSQVL